MQKRPSLLPQPREDIAAQTRLDSEFDGRPLHVPTLRPLPQQAADGQPALKFKPVMLRTWLLCLTLAFNCLVFGLLFLLLYVEGFDFTHQWGYLSIQILPPIIGTISAALLRGIALSYYRITPFMLAAAPHGETFYKTILASYFPGLSLRSALATRKFFLAFVWIMEILADIVLALKAALLNTTRYSDYVETVVTSWVALTLLGIYGLMIILEIVVAFGMHNRVTGLRWDPVSIADHLVLFRHSDFLDNFEGTDTATRDSMIDRLRDRRLKLGYWRRDDAIWHGFGTYSEVNTQAKRVSDLVQVARI